MRSFCLMGFAASIAATALGCGGKATTSASTARDAQQGSGWSSDGTPEASTDPCRDGTCVTCGDGICPDGFYCETTGARSGCAWSTACPSKPTCACLQAELRDDPKCTCEQREGFAFVTCAQ
ncbi:MAG: hypothetical protein MUF54_17000 [Polyangiaceae bacterium]|nr:hypothetical protein [Polyangiaceae bacterium]